ncbi:putative lipid II flippase FtsW [Clostridium sp.]|uniref:putative lipid II flippase FtsW n=1 Tax=Clostridium sp. TaxID=1506 RepID=UPI0025C5B139|nr:putative lipid II flippase FtsW [Clostridium sp.]
MGIYNSDEFRKSNRRRKNVEKFRQMQRNEIRKNYGDFETENYIQKETPKGAYKIGKFNKQVFYSVLILLSIGTIMIFSSSSYYSLYEKGDAYYFLKKQLFSLVIGIIAMIVFMGIDYHRYEKYTKHIYIGTIFLLGAVFLFPDINGAHRWILVGGQSLQPSEIAKYAIVIFLASMLSKNKDELKDFFKGPIKYLLASGIFAALIYKQPNMSIAVVIMAVTFVMLFIARCKISHLGFLVACGLGLVFKMIMGAGYRMSRWTSFLNPWADPSGESYQLIQSFYSLGSGSVFGKGLGQSIHKALYMPEPHNDFIFAIIGEELGLFGCIAIICLFVFLILSSFKIADKAIDSFGMYIASGITLVITIQAIINMAVVSGSMPVTGVPLPFISYGGTSLIFNLAAVGILLNISRQRRI